MLFGLLMAALNTEPAHAAIIGKDDFDSPYIANNRIIQLPINTQSTTWDIVNRNTLMSPNMMDVSVMGSSNIAKNSSDSLGFIDSRKTDKFFGMHRSGSTRKLIYTFNVSNHVNLSFKMDWATSGDVTDKDVKVTASLDGASPVTILRIGSSINSWSETFENNTTYIRNRRAEVTVNGQPVNFLTDNFQTYSTNITGIGSTLTVEVVMNSTVAFGGFGLDNLELNGSIPTDYTAWANAYGLSGVTATRTSDLDGDGYDNMLEYVLGLNPGGTEAAGADRFTVSNNVALLTIPQAARQDVFYQILRCSDDEPGSLYPDWEIFASRWGTTSPWVCDYQINDPSTGTRKLSFTVPSEYSNDKFRLVVMDPGVYPEFQWDVIEPWTFPRLPTGQDAHYTQEDVDFVAGLDITCNNLATLPDVEGAPTWNELERVLLVNPNQKYLSYLNGTITYPDSAGYLNLNNMDESLWALEVDGSNPLQYAYSTTGVTRTYIDYRKQSAMDRQCDIAAALKDLENDGVFIDAIPKIGTAMAYIKKIPDQMNFLDSYYQFLSFIRSEYADGIRVANTRPSQEHSSYLDGISSDRYTKLEAVLNDYFNGLYLELWYSTDKRKMSSTIDWVINRWSRHGKLLLITADNADPSDPANVMELATTMIMLGRNSFVRFTGGVENLNYAFGGWKNPTYLEFLKDKRLGAPLSDAVKTGDFVYTRTFEHAKVDLDLNKASCRIEWYDQNGNLDDVWEKLPPIDPLATSIGYDDFGSDLYGMTRNIYGQQDVDDITWGIVKRSSLKCQHLLDTSEFDATGGPGDGVDKLGFVKSTKIDPFFGMYRAGLPFRENQRTLIYTCDITGYSKLALQMDWAKAGDTNDPLIRVVATIDDGPEELIFNMESVNRDQPKDVMENETSTLYGRGVYGTSNGVRTSFVTNDFNTFAARIAGKGRQLKLAITTDYTTGFRAFGLDNVELFGLWDPYVASDAENFYETSSPGVQIANHSWGGSIGIIQNEYWVRFNGMNFAEGASACTVRAATPNNACSVELRLDSPSGILVGTVSIGNTGGWDSYSDFTATVTGATGSHDLYLVFKGGSGYLMNVDQFTFIPVSQ
jgi:Carbohydrate binding module (family 6)/Hypothetical glycosyl hydrolase family 15